MPDNIVVASFEHAETKYVTVRRLKILEVNDSDQLNMLNSTTYDYLKAKLEYTDGELFGNQVFTMVRQEQQAQLIPTRMEPLAHTCSKHHFLMLCKTAT
ncbi:hypothetical protein KIN20_010416 [Parelaphostrongylus tenuis]|uniref:Uncharacterized protein n=1 Tax=Parelaphostrongylus tenuis TaxID=148309 RepID=A0AAD5M9M0_PARTN|nr:hypothetical protein KIN20_010416 [Parelaphostrongylus tenuis]